MATKSNYQKPNTLIGALRFFLWLLFESDNSLNCKVEQDGRKAVTTTDNNSILGRYIRQRIRVDEDSPITVEDLESYGRTDFVLSKIDDETFLFDISV